MKLGPWRRWVIIRCWTPGRGRVIVLVGSTTDFPLVVAALVLSVVFIPVPLLRQISRPTVPVHSLPCFCSSRTFMQTWRRWRLRLRSRFSFSFQTRRRLTSCSDCLRTESTVRAAPGRTVSPRSSTLVIPKLRTLTPLTSSLRTRRSCLKQPW